jgi:hypothetical protein
MNIFCLAEFPAGRIYFIRAEAMKLPGDAQAAINKAGYDK